MSLRSVKALLIILCVSVGYISFGQFNEKKKAAKEQLRTAKEDTTKVILLNNLAYLTNKNNFVEAYAYAKEALELSEKLNYLYGRINSYNNIGDAFWYHTDYIKAQDNYFKAYRLNDSIKDEVGIANSLYNIGWIIC